MTYLLVHFWGWLLAALALGATVGFMTFSRTQKGYWPEKWSSSFLILLALLVIGIILAGLKTVLNLTGLWLETSVLLLLSYLVGCFLGSAFASCNACKEATCAITDSPSDPSKPVGFMASSETSSSASTGEDVHPGIRPTGIELVENVTGDDLKIILGIADINETRLHELGIYYFHQIASWTPENTEWVGSYLAFPGRIERENWVGQAKALLEGATPEDLKNIPHHH